MFKKLIVTLALLFFALNLSADMKDAVEAAKLGDLPLALKEFKLAGEEGDVDAQYNAGAMYYSGAGADKNIKQAINWLSKAAEQKHIKASFTLGYIYYVGDGVARDPEQAYKWFNVSAKQKHAGSQVNLATMHLKGDGTTKDAAKAIEWFTLAADQGHVVAQHNLAMLYLTGNGTEQNHTAAHEWFAKAAEGGNKDSQYHLGNLYLNGRGVDVDTKQAANWFEKAADNGNSQALYGAALLAYSGYKDQDPDYEKALKLFKRASIAWNRDAQQHLGVMYYQGRGTKKDLDVAYKWLDLSAASGHMDAHYWRSVVASEMTTEQVASAHAAAQKWFDENHDTPHEHYNLTPHDH